MYYTRTKTLQLHIHTCAPTVRPVRGIRCGAEVLRTDMRNVAIVCVCNCVFFSCVVRRVTSDASTRAENVRCSNAMRAARVASVVLAMFTYAKTACVVIHGSRFTVDDEILYRPQNHRMIDGVRYAIFEPVPLVDVD